MVGFFDCGLGVCYAPVVCRRRVRAGAGSEPDQPSFLWPRRELLGVVATHSESCWLFQVFVSICMELEGVVSRTWHGGFRFPCGLKPDAVSDCGDLGS